MEAVVAIGVASSVLTFVDFGFKTVKTLREIKQKGETKHAADLRQVINPLRSDCESLRKSLASATQTPASNQSDIVALSQSCVQTADDLLALLDSLVQPEKPPNLFRRLRMTFKAMQKKSTIEGLEQKLLRYQRALDSKILHDLSANFDFKAVMATEAFKCSEQRVQKLTEMLASGITDFQRLVSAESHATRVHVTAEVDRAISTAANKEELKLILENLRFPTMKTRFETIEPQHEKTFTWIWAETPKESHLWSSFYDWLHSDNSTFYWINGIPGSGKSTLMSYIYQDRRLKPLLRNWSRSHDIVVIQYFFWSQADPLQRSICGMFRSLLHQICQYSQGVLTSPEVRSVVEFNDSWAWPEARLKSVANATLDCLLKSFRLFVLIDGLDETDADFNYLCRTIQRTFGRPGIKVCMASRPLAQFHESFKTYPSLKLQDLNRNDLAAFTRDALNDACHQGHSKERLTSAILGRAEGMFLWVKLVVRDIVEGLLEGNGELELISRLSVIPQDVNGLYDHILRAIPPGHRCEVAKWFLILQNQLQPLDLQPPDPASFFGRSKEYRLFPSMYTMALTQQPPRDMQKMKQHVSP